MTPTSKLRATVLTACATVKLLDVAGTILRDDAAALAPSDAGNLADIATRLVSEHASVGNGSDTALIAKVASLAGAIDMEAAAV